MSKTLINIYKKAHIWRLRHISMPVYMVLLSIVVGVCSGFAAVLLKTGVHFLGQALTRLSVATVAGGNLMILVYPSVGILLSVLYARYVAHGEIGHGIPSVLLSISRHKGVLPARNIYNPLIASSLTVSFGGSVGLEAPIASTGSAIGSNVGQFCRLNLQQVKLLLGCGAAGAIAGIFKAPIAGILFVVEVLMFDLNKTSAVPLLFSSLSANTVAYFLMGPDVQFAFQVTEAFALSQIPFYVLLGVFCAVCSVYFLRMTDAVEQYFARHRRRTRFVLGSVLLGVMIFLFPPLYGEGYGSLTALLHGNSDILFAGSIFAPMQGKSWAAIAMLLVLILTKAIATATTIGSGGVGGTFGPSLVLGGLSGYCVALICNQMGLPEQSTANFALVGMAAVMTGVMQAPFMATLLIAEITGGYALLVPLLITSAVTFICVSPFERHSIYARKLAEQGDLLTHDKDRSAWQLINMRKLIECNFATVRQGQTLGQLVEAVKNSRRNIFPVLSADDKFLGVIILDDIRQVMFRTELYDTTTVDELMHPLSEGDVVSIDDSPQTVVQKFRSSERYNLVVIDTDGRYIGFLSRANTFSAYRRFISDTSDE
ncbi:MAG: chloride channel protein [Bacteroidales bacterium]|nr:chloride channel protein [Bacteroidales bacterium]